MKAEIITIGDELLIGQVVDTNSAWICELLNSHGIEVFQVTSVHDNHKHIIDALEVAGKRSDLILITGGLGPTKDDITKHALCDYFGCDLVTDRQVLKHISRMLARRNMEVNTLNREQALVPRSCKVLHNALGTAPGMWFEHNNTIFVAMPGVPFEMKRLMEKKVIPKLRKKWKTKTILHRNVLVTGITEAALAEVIEAWESALPEHINLAYLPNPLAIRLRLSVHDNDRAQMEKEVSSCIEALKTIIPDNIFGYDNDTMAGVTGQLLLNAKATVGVAESCTGGYIAHSFTSTPGSSAYFKGSITAYSNEVKTALLGVDPDLIAAHGAVSSEVAAAMATGAKKALGVDYAIATTGIAGPDGGVPGKPVGTVWVAVAANDCIVTKRFNFASDRERNIIRFSQAAIDMLRLLMKATAIDNGTEIAAISTGK